MQLRQEAGEYNTGVSPRGSIAVIAMAKAEAFLRGNNYVLPSDIKNIAVETFAHRIVN